MFCAGEVSRVLPLFQKMSETFFIFTAELVQTLLFLFAKRWQDKKQVVIEYNNNNNN